MTIPDYIYSRHVSNSKLRTFEDNIGELERLYADRSYALVRVGYKSGVSFMPLIPRHMTSAMWRDLWWHRVKKLVVGGQVFKSLCSLCPLALSCIVDQREKGASFECTAVAKNFHIDVGRRQDAQSP
jgi:hypothetical protein